MKQITNYNDNGFTLLEMIFAVGLFMMVITMVTGVFAKSSQTQKKVMELHTIQREGNFMIEMMSREMRMATAIEEGQACNSDHDIEFDNYDGASTKYCRSDDEGNCLLNGEYLARNNEVISSSNIKIDNLKFYSNNFTDANNEQPMITISMTVEPAVTRYNTKISLQNSVVLRVYK